MNGKQNMYRVFCERAALQPHHPAIMGPGENQLLSYAQLKTRIDEVAQIHEQTVTPLIIEISGLDAGKPAWMYLYIPLLFVFCAAYIPFLLHLPGPTATLFVVSGGFTFFHQVAHWWNPSGTPE